MRVCDVIDDAYDAIDARMYAMRSMHVMQSLHACDVLDA